VPPAGAANEPGAGRSGVASGAGGTPGSGAVRRPRVYLAGPDVFLPDSHAWAARRGAVCAAFGLEGVSPLDPLPDSPAEWLGLPDWQRIFHHNEAHIRRCDAVIANLTPFRGPSADVGTVYEVGFARALGLPVFGYACVAADLLARTRAALGPTVAADAAEDWWDGDGLLVENFGLFENLMIAGGILASGGLLLAEDAPTADRWRDLAVFERCVAQVAERLSAGAAG